MNIGKAKRLNSVKNLKIFLLFFLLPFFTAEGQKVLLGIDVLQRENYSILNGKNVGLITNHTGVNRSLTSTLDLFKKAKNFKLTAVFSPEHGLKGTIGSGQAYSDSTDKASGIKFFSLYGSTQRPTKEMLDGIDALVYDIQDVGIRSYTYISTLGYAMEAAADNKIDFIVLDRPNPMGGLRVEGNLVEDDFVTFVSRYKIPYVYGLTCGELATLLNEKKMLTDKVQCKLSVVKMEGWKREMKFRDTGLIWVPTSPNVPEPETPFYMVATGILGELVVVGIGITYTLPFETFAAEWINADTLADRMNKLNLPGVIFRPIVYKILYGSWQDKIFSGVQIHITDFDKVELLDMQLYFMQVNHQLYPQKDIFDLANNGRIKMFDKVFGTDRVRKRFSQRYKVKDVKRFLMKDVETFKKMSSKFYLYD